MGRLSQHQAMGIALEILDSVKRQLRGPAPPAGPEPIPCTDCGGTRELDERTCRHSSPCPCGTIAVGCPRCEHTDGAEPCEGCGSEPAVYVLEWDSEVGRVRSRYCGGCAAEMRPHLEAAIS